MPTISKNFLVLTNTELDIFRTDQPCPLEGVGGRKGVKVNIPIISLFAKIVKEPFFQTCAHSKSPYKVFKDNKTVIPITNPAKIFTNKVFVYFPSNFFELEMYNKYTAIKGSKSALVI